jgi:hypothetical protein
MTERPAEGQGTYQRLPVVGSLLRRQRREAERVITGLVDATMRDTVGLNAIVRRLNILNFEAIIARLDIGAIASRLDIAGIVDRLDIDALLARIDINAIIARLDIDAIAARIDMGAIVERLDIDAVATRLDVAELVARLDSAKRDDQPADDVGPLGDGG